MKHNILLKFILLIIFLSFIISNHLRSRTKTKNKSKFKSRNKGKFRERSHYSKKNGPLNWEESNENILDQFIKNERNLENSYKIKDLPKYSKFPYTNRRGYISDNQKSLTFRSVGPNDDSTINKNGVKYSKIYNNANRNNKVSAGFYGSSRLTR